MIVKELVGKEIMKAYDGNYLSRDFGYSCANFNVEKGPGMRAFENFGGSENDEPMFDFYTLNVNNISCFVCYDERNKICGRRMFFKGESMINHQEFDYPIKRGDEVKYLYGYYGRHDREPIRSINKAVLDKYANGIIFTDKEALRNGRVDTEIPQYWIMRVENANYPKYPPIDFLSISTELRALSNFDPERFVIEILEKDYNVRGVEFHAAYRYKPGQGRIKYDYKTWDQHKGVIKGDEDYTKKIQDEDEEIDLADVINDGDTVVSKNSGKKYVVKSVGVKSVTLELPDGKDWELSRNHFNILFQI